MKILWFVDIIFDTTHDKVTWLETVRSLQKKMEVNIITRYKYTKVQFKELNTSINYIESFKIPYINRFLTYRNQVQNFGIFIKKFDPDVLLFNSHNFFLLEKAHVLQNKYRYKTFLDIRTIPVTYLKLKNRLEKHFFKKSLRLASHKFNGISYITEEMRDHCKKKYGLPEHCSAVWSSGVNIHYFTPPEKEKRRDVFTLIYHGNIAKNRGLDQLIRAQALLKAENIKLILLGSGNGIAHLKKLTHKLGLQKKVIFLPPVPYKKVPDQIQKADAGILPFPDWEGWNTSSPIKLFEYLACGKPVVATKIPAHVNVLQGRDFVFWADKSDPKDMADAIKNAYSQKNNHEKMSKKAREFVKNNYTWDKQAGKLEEFLRKIIK